MLKVRLLNAIDWANLWRRFNRANYWSIGTVNRVICSLAIFSHQEPNFVSHIHSSDFSVHVYMVSELKLEHLYSLATKY